MPKSATPQINEDLLHSSPSLTIDAQPSSANKSDSYVQKLYEGLSTSTSNSAMSNGQAAGLLSPSTGGGGLIRKSLSSTQIFSSTLPSTGILNFASAATLFPSTPGISPSSFSLSKFSSKSEHTTSENLANAETTWQELSQRVLPLFNGEGLRGSMEDLNEMVR